MISLGIRSSPVASPLSAETPPRQPLRPGPVGPEAQPDGDRQRDGPDDPDVERNPPGRLSGSSAGAGIGSASGCDMKRLRRARVSNHPRSGDRT